ncbi:MAG TPA: adenosylcobinamide-GDP ribazoletransferase [Nocardioides sp.]|nr:adenosylcobinamide-GDP ribazoletransferase [Nocardioides sp.]
MSRAADGARLALGTLTVLPVRPPRRVDRSVGAVAMVLAPVAALPLAAGVGVVVWLADQALPPLLVAALALGALALGSGGLHLDGLADTADGLAAPGDRERRLQVMRAGDVGPVGAVTLVLVLLVQASALAEVVATRGGVGAAVTAGLAVLISRTALTLACLEGIAAARGDGLGVAVAGSVPRPAGLSVLVGVGAVAWLVDGVPGLAAVALTAVAAGVVLWRAWRRLGGVTGDVLGACVELALAAGLVAEVALPRTG